MKNIVLIGMPGAGKSSIGVILAKTLGMNFVDTDLVIQERAGMLLQKIINADGPAAFLATEEKTILSLHCTNTVIATGGSVVLSARAMEHLHRNAMIVYLEISFSEMQKRLRNIKTRGIVLLAGQDLHEMFDQRASLYENYADLTIRSSGDDVELVVQKIMITVRTA